MAAGKMGFLPLTPSSSWKVEAPFLLAGNDGDSDVTVYSSHETAHFGEKGGESSSINPPSCSQEQSPAEWSPAPAGEALGTSALTSGHPFQVFPSLQSLANTYLLATEQPWSTSGHTEEKKAAPTLLLCPPRITGGHGKLRAVGQATQISCSNFSCHEGQWPLFSLLPLH